MRYNRAQGNYRNQFINYAATLRSRTSSAEPAMSLASLTVAGDNLAAVVTNWRPRRSGTTAGSANLPSLPPSERVRVHRRVSATGLIVVCGPKITPGRIHAGQTLTVQVSDTILAIELDGAERHVVRRTTTRPVRNIKADRCGRSLRFPGVSVNHHLARIRPASPGTRHMSSVG